ncbi:hypothetical protein L873DRAFT_1786871 [Choiromyces venosus 120613-1]|uniref:Uncharacterized protein n=1 Tax=Choiromyces venosus 120613-1 TaxID=1336337 RepID=A0A3N4JYH6_9PEZI|nr:hypothetical protein L873DRAFT_1786871 [Choiromyces venosus 120613-1]
MATRTRFKSSSPAPSSLSASTTMTLDSVAAAAAQQTTSTTAIMTTSLPPNFQQQFPPQTQVLHHPYPNAGHLHHHHPHPRGPPPRLDDYVAAKIAPEDPTRRFSSTPDSIPLAILNFHNAVPRNYGNHSVPSCGPVPVVLPPVGGAGGGGGVNGVGSVGHVLGQPPASSYGAQYEPREEEDAVPQFRYQKNENSYHHRYAPAEKSRSLSIQSLISSPELSPPTSYSNNDGQSGTRKRKGSDGDVGGSHGARSGSIVSTTVTMDDPEVREVVEALGGLKGGEYTGILLPLS